MVDEIDRKIITKLQSNGRLSLKELAKTVGYTSMGVKKRLDKLLDRGIIKVTALHNTAALKMRAIILLLEVESGEAMRNILQRFKNCPRIVYLFTTLGGYNLIAIAIGEDQDTLESEMEEKCSLRSSPGIRRSEVYPIGEIHYHPYLPIREYLAVRREEIAPCGVNCGVCPRYKGEKCLGCPATKYYRGPL